MRLAGRAAGGRQNGEVGHSYPLPTIKLLFATARTCACPPCATPLVFIDEDHGVREVAVQIAHIRSPKRDGPRHDPTFPADRLNREENLLLLCGVHHHPCSRRHQHRNPPGLCPTGKNAFSTTRSTQS